MQRTIDETDRRRKKQMLYNEEHGITPTPIVKKSGNDLIEIYESSEKNNDNKRASAKTVSRKDTRKPSAPKPYYEEEHKVDVAADPVIGYMAPDELSAQIEKLNARMVAAAKRTDFIEAAQLRDEMLKLKDRLESIKK